MTTTIARARRTAVVVLGSTSLALSLAACGGLTGGNGESTSEASSAEATTSAPATSETATTSAPATTETSASAPAAASATQPATDADLEPAKQRFVDFYKAVGDNDLEGACGMVLDPTTGTGMSGGSLKDTCIQALQGSQSTYASAKDAVSTDVLDAALQPDGTIAITPKGGDSSLKVPVAKGTDGQLYVHLMGATDTTQG